MIDESDADAFWVLSLVTDNPVVALVCAVAFCTAMYVACQNEKTCEAKSCGAGEVARLLDHECVCVRAAK